MSIPEVLAPDAETAITVPSDPRAVEGEARSVIQRANALVVTLETYEAAGGVRAGLIAEADRRRPLIDKAVEAAHTAHKNAVAIRKAWVDSLLDAAKIIKGKMIAVDEEEKRKAEKKRLELEAAEKKKAEDEALEVAALLEEIGDKEAAEELLSKPPEVAPVAVQKATPKIEGFKSLTHYYAAITDLKAYLQAIVNGDLPLAAAMGIDKHKDAPECYGCSYLTSRVTTDKETLAVKVPSVKVWSKKV